MEKSLLSRVPTNLATRGFFQHLPGAAENPSGRQPGPMQRPAQGRSAAERKKHRSGRSGAMQGTAEGRSSLEQPKRGVTEKRSATSSKLSPNQKTELRGVVTGGDVRGVDHVNFSRSVGTRHPRTAVLYDLPETIVNVVPQYRGFKCMVVQNELIIVDPGTRHRSRSPGMTWA